MPALDACVAFFIVTPSLSKIFEMLLPFIVDVTFTASLTALLSSSNISYTILDALAQGPPIVALSLIFPLIVPEVSICKGVISVLYWMRSPLQRFIVILEVVIVRSLYSLTNAKVSSCTNTFEKSCTVGAVLNL